MKWLVAMTWVVLVGCSDSKPAARPAPARAKDAVVAKAPPDASAEIPARPGSADEAAAVGVALLADAGKAIVTATDCAGRGAALGAWADRNAKRLADAAAQLKQAPKDALTAALQKELPASADAVALFAAAKGCAADKTFDAAWDHVEALFEPATVADAVSMGLALLESAAHALADAKECPAKGAALAQWTADNADVIVAVTGTLQQFPQDQIAAEVNARLPGDAEANALFEAARACATDRAFGDAWDTVAGLFQPA